MDLVSFFTSLKEVAYAMENKYLKRQTIKYCLL